MKKKLLIILCWSMSYVISWAQNADSLTFVTAAWVNENTLLPIVWQHFHFQNQTLFNSNQNIHLLKIPLLDTSFQIGFASAQDSLYGTPKIAQQVDALIAINGSFFDMKNGGAVDLIKIDGKILDTTRLSKGKRAEHQRAAIAIQGQKIRVVKGDDAQLKWDELLPEDNIMVTGPLLIFENDTVLLKNIPFNSNRHPRSCIGITTTNEVILMTIDGRTAQSQGVSLFELRQILVWLGCKEAINLDGGGSTTLYIQHQPYNGVVNMPCDNRIFDHEGVRNVSNILYIKKKKKL
jgi:exopolysaccharide biosynthesis protein